MTVISNFKQTIISFGFDKVPTFAAALSYYTVFSLGPLLLVLISLLGFFFGRSAIEGEILAQIKGLAGSQTAEVVASIISASQEKTTGIVSLIVGFVLLLLSASGVFGQLKTSLNAILNVEPKSGRGIEGVLRERLLSVAMIGVIGFLLGVSLVITAVVAVVNTYFAGILPLPAIVFELIHIFISFWVILLLFALIYKVLPDVQLPWRIVWGGATLAALLFTIGKSVIGIYIGNSIASSPYGAASSLVVILLWVYYSGLILFLGAEYIKVSADRRGESLTPEPYAYKIKQVVEDEDESSEIEDYIKHVLGTYIGTKLTPIIERMVTPRKKSFWERVEEKLDEDRN